MTKKDYIVIATALRRAFGQPDIIDEMTKSVIVNELCYQLEKENPRFDSVKFKKAVNN